MSIQPVPRIAVIVVAAGSGTRLGRGPKAFVGIDDRSILRHALAGVVMGPVAQIVVVAPAGHEGDALADIAAVAGERRDLAVVVAGGATRQASVAAGLAALWADVEVVLVHDAARALTPPDVFDRVVAAVEGGAPGVVPALAVIDTIKRVAEDAVHSEVDRSELVAAQTPQGFRRDILETAYVAADREFTDDASLVAAAGHRIAVVAGDPLAFKITTPADLDRARSLVTAASVSPADAGETRRLETTESVTAPAPASHLPRVGVGTDVHAFGADGVLRLAGLDWPGEPALAGHSDGDAVAHAIVDALLSAAGLGDIGGLFGTDDPQWAGAGAHRFLTRTRALLGEAGFTIGNVAVQVQANRPRIGARRAEAEAALSAALGGAPVSVSGTTTDGLGFTGRGEGVSVVAVALVVPVSSASGG